MSYEYRHPFTVRISDCDMAGRLRPSALQREVLEIGEVQAANFGLSRNALLAHDMCWVLYRFRAVMRAPVTYGDTLTVTTWPGAPEGPIFTRHTVVERADGAPAAEVITAWVLMSVSTRRPLRPTALPIPIPAHGRPAPLPLPGMLRLDSPVPCGARPILFCDIDVNRHLNNARSLDFALDMLDAATLDTRGVTEWQINYSAEGRPNDVLDLFTQPDGDAALAQARRQADGKTVFEARVVFGES